MLPRCWCTQYDAEAGDDPAVPPVGGLHLVLPRPRGVPVVADVVVVEDHRGRQGRQQPAVGGVGPGELVEVGVLLPVLELGPRRLLDVAPGLDELRISAVVSSAYTWSPRKSTRSGQRTWSPGSGSSSCDPSVTPAIRSAYARSASTPCSLLPASSWVTDVRQEPNASRSFLSGSSVAISGGGYGESGCRPDLLAVDLDRVRRPSCPARAPRRRPARSGGRAPGTSATRVALPDPDGDPGGASVSTQTHADVSSTWRSRGPSTSPVMRLTQSRGGVVAIPGGR